MLGLIALLGVKAALAGFPGLVDGEVPLWTLRPDRHLPEAFSVLGAFCSLCVGGGLGGGTLMRTPVGCGAAACTCVLCDAACCW